MQTTSSFHDRFGLAPSTGSATAAASFEAGVERMLTMNIGALEQFDRALAADPGFALGHAVYALHAQMRGDMVAAIAGVERANSLADRATPQERGLIAGYTAFIGGNGRQALAILREHLDMYPRDTLALSTWFMLMAFGVNARRDRNEEVYAVLSALAHHYEGDWWFASAFSFVNHELDRFDEARRYAELALTRHPRHAQASHSLSHVFYETNDHAGGRSFLRGWLPDYQREAPQFAHLTWHLALFELASGHYRRAMELYARDMEPTVMQARTTLVDAASLLWRLHIYGAADAPLPWEPVREYAARTVHRPGMAFADVHAALAYAATGDDAAMRQLIAGLTELDANGHPLAGSVVLPLVRGVEAFSQGAYDETIRQIAPITGEIVRIGGSNAQRQVFEDTLLQAYLRAERFDEAEVLLRARLGRRESARDHFWFGQAQIAQGQHEGASSSLRAARAGWSDADPEAPELTRLARLEMTVQE